METYCSAVPDIRRSEVYPGRPSPSYCRYRPLSASFLFDLSDTVGYSLPIDDRTVYDRDWRVPVPPHFRPRPGKIECRVSRVLVDDHLECDRGSIVHVIDGLQQSSTTVTSKYVTRCETANFQVSNVGHQHAIRWYDASNCDTRNHGLETHRQGVRLSHLGSSDQHLPDRLFRITTQRPDRDRVD